MANNNQKQSVPYIKAHIDKVIDDPSSKTKAYATVTIGGAFAAHGLRVIDSDRGMFMAMPSRAYQDENGNRQYSEYFHSISKEGYQALNNAVTTAYYDAISQTVGESYDDVEDDIEEFEQSM